MITKKELDDFLAWCGSPYLFDWQREFLMTALGGGALYTHFPRGGGRAQVMDLINKYNFYLKEKENMAIFNREKEEAPVVQMTEDSWIWVDGYKGTEADMYCKDYKYELGKLHEMPEDVDIKTCRSGFHLCLELKHVFNYYELGEGRRYFKVKALVRAKDVAEYGKVDPDSTGDYTKLAAKAIVFEHELTVEELYDYYVQCRPAMRYTMRYTIINSVEDMRMAMEHGCKYVKNYHDAQELLQYGYSQEMAMYITKSSRAVRSLAIALGSQTDISMDTRVAILFQCFNTNVQLTEIYNSSRRGRTI